MVIEDLFELRNVSEREENEEEAGSPKDLIMILDSIVH
jgi:hypothetical protein